MDQYKTVNRVLRDLKMMGIISEDVTGEIRPFLLAIWASGWEESRKEQYGHGSKPIGQYSETGKLLNIYRSQREAAQRTGFTPDGIVKAMHRGTPTKQGWLWRYI